MNLIVAAVILLIIFFVGKVCLQEYNYDKCLRRFVCPPGGIPIFGHIFEFKNSSEVLVGLLKFSKTHDIFKLQMGPLRPTLFISNANFLNEILTSNVILDKSEIYKYTHNWLGTGLLTAPGSKWKTHRKSINPAFNIQVLENFIKIMDISASLLVEKLANISYNLDSFNISDLISFCSLDIICESAMGVSIRAQENENSEYVNSVKEMCRIILDRSMSVRKALDVTYFFSRDYFIERKCLKYLHGITNFVITKKKKTLENADKSKGNDKDTFEGEKTVKLAFLDLLLETRINGVPLSQDDIRHEVDTFMFAGHDTTSAAISFAIYELANNSAIQELVFEEQKSIFEDDMKRPINHQDLQDMKYLEMVIKETLRLYPSVPLYSRELKEDFEFEGEIIPKGVCLFIFAYGLHRNEKYFPEPEVFDPNRFANGSDIKPFTYLPFSAGPRNCIGQKFAMLVIKTILSKLLRSYELIPASPKHELKLATEVVLTSKNGIHIGIKKRQY